MNSLTTFAAAWIVNTATMITPDLITDRSASYSVFSNEPGCKKEMILWRMHVASMHSMIIWDDNGYTSQSPLVHINCTLNNGHYIPVLLRSAVLPFI